MRAAPSFELPNVGPGPDPCSLDALAADHDFVLVLLQRDHYCTNCRKQVQSIADAYDEFTARDAEVVSIVPEPRSAVQDWQDSYDLPYPLLADPDASAGDAYDQPVRFGFLGAWSDFLGRMPEAVLIDTRGDAPTVGWSHAGQSTFDRPDVTDLLDAIDDHPDADASDDHRDADASDDHPDADASDDHPDADDRDAGTASQAGTDDPRASEERAP